MPKVLKSYGTQGAVSVSPAFEQDELDFKEPVFIKFDKLPVPFFFESVTPHGSHSIVKFEDIDTLSDAESLVGREISFTMEEEADGDDDDLKGRTVCDQSGRKVGTITEFLNFNGNTCIEVQRAGGKGKTVLPIHEDLIVKVTSGSIWIRIPEGLL